MFQPWVEENSFCWSEQHELVGLGAEQHDIGLAEEMRAIDEAVFGAVRLDMPFGVREHLEGLADDRPAFVAGDVGQLVALGRSEAVRRGGHILHRHDDCSGWLDPANITQSSCDDSALTASPLPSANPAH
ncbi:hypothetical protein ACVWXL_007724 [Bradyrhizobium sp. GM22.5]